MTPNLLGTLPRFNRSTYLIKVNSKCTISKTNRNQNKPKQTQTENNRNIRIDKRQKNHQNNQNSSLNLLQRMKKINQR